MTITDIAKRTIELSEQMTTAIENIDKHPPLLSELRAHIRNVTEQRRASGNSTEQYRPACSKCEYRGYFFMTDAEMSTTFVAACPDCLLGKYFASEAPHKLPTVSRAKSRGYFVQPKQPYQERGLAP